MVQVPVGSRLEEAATVQLDGVFMPSRASWRISLLLYFRHLSYNNTFNTRHGGVLRCLQGIPTRALLPGSAIPPDTRSRAFLYRVTWARGRVVDYAIYMLDPEGLVISWNVGPERIKVYTVEEIIGQHFSDFYTEEVRAGDAVTALLGLQKG